MHEKRTIAHEKRLSCKELAAALAHHPNYVSAMRRAGFTMIGGRATLREALEWLGQHQGFRRDGGDGRIR
jgi:hypothetical protein